MTVAFSLFISFVVLALVSRAPIDPTQKWAIAIFLLKYELDQWRK